MFRLTPTAFVAGILAMPAAMAAAADTPAALNFKMKSLDGKDVDLGQYLGKVVLVVNVASKCGLTPQYRQLPGPVRKAQKGWAGDPRLSLQPVPPAGTGHGRRIQQFCTAKYGVSFPLFAKIEVNGDGACDLYKYLTALDAKPKGPGKVTWNFEKFVIGRNGQVVARFAPTVKPDDPAIVKIIEAELAK